MIPDSHKDLLEQKVFGDVATVGPDGSPRTQPVWLDWDGTHLLFSQTTRREKYRNAERYWWHRPGDHRVVVKVEPQYASWMG